MPKSKKHIHQMSVVEFEAMSPDGLQFRHNNRQNEDIFGEAISGC